jgi:hypothetical protein
MAARSWVPLLAPLLLGAPRADPGPCPAGFAADPLRARAIEERLSADDEARALLREAGGAAICFGPGAEPGITPERVILLPPGMLDPLADARVAHLLHHRRAGSPLAGPPAGDCARWVDQALAEEARAHALELRLLRAAGASSPLPFAEAREPETIERWLREHPEGAPGVPAYGLDYAARCRNAEDLPLPSATASRRSGSTLPVVEW